MRLQLILCCLIFWLGAGTSLYQGCRDGAVVPAAGQAGYHKIVSNNGQVKSGSTQYEKGYPHQEQSVAYSSNDHHPRVLPHEPHSGTADVWYAAWQHTKKPGASPRLYLRYTTGYISTISWLLYPKHSFW